MALRVRTLHDLTPVAQNKMDAAKRARDARTKLARQVIKAALTGKKPDAKPMRHGRGEARLQAMAATNWVNTRQVVADTVQGFTVLETESSKVNE